jgi:hypothetical protein
MFDYLKLKTAIYKEFYNCDNYKDIKVIFRNHDSILLEFDFIYEIYYDHLIPTRLMFSSNDVDLILLKLGISNIKQSIESTTVVGELKTIINNEENSTLPEMVKNHFRETHLSSSTLKIKKAKAENKKSQNEYNLKVKFKKRISFVDAHMKSSKAFLSIDLEFAATKRGSFITEIGYSFYDSKTEKIENKHYIILDNLHERKYCYIPEGHMELFSYGDSERTSLSSAKKQLKSIINKADCLIFHGAGADLKLLSDVFDASSCKIIDTSKLSQAIFEQLDGASLGNILKRYDMEEQPLHNAGNDAVLTMLILAKLVNNENFTPIIKVLKDYTNDHNFVSNKIYKECKLPIRRQTNYINNKLRKK